MGIKIKIFSLFLVSSVFIIYKIYIISNKSNKYIHLIQRKIILVNIILLIYIYTKRN